MYGTERLWKGPKPWVKNEQPRAIDVHRAKLNKRAAKLSRIAKENAMKKRKAERASASASRRGLYRDQVSA